MPCIEKLSFNPAKAFLERLQLKINTNKHIISTTINTETNANLFSFINQYRIKV